MLTALTHGVLALAVFGVVLPLAYRRFAGGGSGVQPFDLGLD